MDLNIPRPVPRRDGDYSFFVNIGYGDPYAVIHLAEGSALDLTNVSVEDCDRLIRAACKVKEQLLGFQAKAAAPHGRANLYQGTCQLCGKPEADELHAEPEPEPSGMQSPAPVVRIVSHPDASAFRQGFAPDESAAGQ